VTVLRVKPIFNAAPSSFIIEHSLGERPIGGYSTAMMWQTASVRQERAMYRRSLTRFSRPLLSLALAGFLVFHSGASMAQNAPLTPQQVSQFVANPASALAANPNGGGRLVSYVRDLLLSDRTTLQAIIALLATANADQQSAIGSGLGQAAQALASTDPDLANQIQRLLAASGSNLAIASYQATTGNVQTGAAGGGGAGGGGGPTGGGSPSGGGGGGSGGTGGTSGGGTASTGGALTGSSGVNGSTPSVAANVSPR
jgi:hypothetical protein